MGKNVQRKGDKNTKNGAIQVGVDSVHVNGKPIAVQGKSVVPHQPSGQHNSSRAKATQSAVKAGGKAVVIKGDSDTCGDKRVGGSPSVNIG